MSSDTSVSLVAALTVFNIEVYCNVAPAVMFIYDAILTFDREVACFWTARWTGASVLFLANKWISVSVLIIVVLAHFITFPSHEVSTCSTFMKATIAYNSLQPIPWAVFSALRAYVLSRRKIVALLILALSLAPMGANLVPFGYGLSGEYLPSFGYLETDSMTDRMHIRLVLMSRIPLIVADVMLICITWMTLSSRDTLDHIQQPRRRSLSYILLLDGTIYFIVLFVLNVLHLALSATALVIQNNGASYVTQFTNAITAVLVSRFLLELQEANQAVVRLDSDDPLHSSRDPYNDTPSFISSLGAFIDPDLSAQCDDDWDVGSRPHAEEGGVETSKAVTSSHSA